MFINFCVKVACYLIYDVVKLLLNLLLYLFSLISWQREVSHLILKLLEQTLIFIFLFLNVLHCYPIARLFLHLTTGLVL